MISRAAVVILVLGLFCTELRSQNSIRSGKYFTFRDTAFAVGDVMILPVWFSFDGGGRVMNESYALVDSVIMFLRVYPALVVEFGTHTDSRGNDDYNLRLSQARAKRLRELLVYRGVDTTRCSFKGYGETTPIMPNEVDGIDNPDGRRANRRAEMLVREIRFVDYIRPKIIVNSSDRMPSQPALTWYIVPELENDIDSILNAHNSCLTRIYKSYPRKYVYTANDAGLTAVEVRFNMPRYLIPQTLCSQFESTIIVDAKSLRR
jgi:hypothetical protein